jgi:hypothetical protein
VRDDRLLPHVDAWLSQVYAPDQIAVTAQHVVDANAEANREDPAVKRARAAVADCDRRISKYLDGLNAGIPADVIASRIAAAQREKAATKVGRYRDHACLCRDRARGRPGRRLLRLVPGPGPG